MSPIMFVHIALGVVGVLAGAIALFSPKGSRPHRIAGNVFFPAMTVMAAASIYLAIVLPMAISILVGVFTIYLVATSWMTVRRPEGSVGMFDYIALLAAFGVAGGGVIFGLEAQGSPSGLKDGLPAFPHFFFGGLALLAAAGDVVMIARGGVAGKQRIARHLWRMCFALFVAVGSLFTGPGASAFPESIQGSPLLSAPEFIVIAAMAFWLIRVLFTRWYGKADAA